MLARLRGKISLFIYNDHVWLPFFEKSSKLMKVEFWVVGKTSYAYIEEGEQVYSKRLRRYFPFKTRVLKAAKARKNQNPSELAAQEAEYILQQLQNGDHLILLDERGKQYRSVAFAQHLQQLLNGTARRLIFLVGGAYGFAPSLYQRANEQWSLSKMTFSHQMIRLFALEQLYRGMSILHNEPYHNE